ncbi:hypothetical protein FCN18_38140 [Prauserella endophytica]|uniref:Uncharacterized protein n=1 Tax=Prauserella endophytica TaxID=1592324 RepID=A0ABY2RSC7_9PSEU|nr:hypothetical protein FCN18_38140 [Prauserella endophytica]
MGGEEDELAVLLAAWREDINSVPAPAMLVLEPRSRSTPTCLFCPRFLLPGAPTGSGRSARVACALVAVAALGLLVLHGDADCQPPLGRPASRVWANGESGGVTLGEPVEERCKPLPSGWSIGELGTAEAVDLVAVQS